MNDKQEEKKQKRKTEEAKRIASRSDQILDKNYHSIARILGSIIRKFNFVVDYIIHHSFLSKLAAVLIAVILFFSVHSNNEPSVNAQPIFGKDINDVKIEAIYDKNKYQVENLPDSVNMSLTGTLEELRRSDTNEEVKAIADLSNYKAGSDQNVSLIYGGVTSGVNVKFSQPSFNVNIFERHSKTFNLGYELINQPVNDKAKYTISFTPNKLELRASDKTLAQVASVYALVDVANKDKNFDTIANIVAFDNQGNRIDDMIYQFNTIKVNVKVNK